MSSISELRRILLKSPSYTYQQFREGGIRGAAFSLWIHGCKKGSKSVMQVAGPVGTPIWEYEWDVLVILDACRVDLMRQVAKEYEFIGDPDDVKAIWSVGSKSNEWMERTFDAAYQNEIEQSAYITGNPYSAKVNFEVEPAMLEEVWRDAWSDEHSTILPRPLTDRAIEVWREATVDRMIVHYMQPHAPFVEHPQIGSYGDPEDFGRGFDDMWALAGKEIPFDRIWPAYRDNLRYVLDDLRLLLENLDADVIITADHGNALGEFGFTGHPPNLLHPHVRRVPWIRTQGTDTGQYSPTIDLPEFVDDDTVSERLRQLGYTE